ncbi:MAG: hypothetical protein Q9216_005978 [Gyalolechia sp. 2 TL-2023]
MSSTITSEQWDQRKEEILRLYIDEGWALKPVMRAMRSVDFDPTECQYRTKLKKWKRRKPRNSHQQSTETAETHPSASLTLGSRPVESTSQGYHPPADWCNKPTNHIPPFRGEPLDPMMISCQTPYQWQDGFIGADGQYQASSVEQPAVARVPVPSKMDIESPHDDNFHFQPQFGSMFLNSEGLKAHAKKMAADTKFGNPGHSRIEGVQRMRRQPPSQHIKTIYPCPDIAQASYHQLSHAKELLPETTSSGCFPDARGITGEDVWWQADTTSDTKSRIPQQSFAEDLLNL